MSIADKFRKPAAGQAQPSTQAAPRGGPGRSRFKGVRVQEPRSAMPDVGVYRLRVVEIVEGHNPKKGSDSFKAKFEIVGIAEGGEHHLVGETVTMVEMLTGPAGLFGVGRVKGFVMACAGFDPAEDEAKFDEYDPDGLLVEALLGASNEYSKDAAEIIGGLVDCAVQRGNDVVNPTTGQTTGDFYRIYVWSPAPAAA